MYRPVRGTHDALPAAMARVRGLERRMAAAVERFGYRETHVPVLERLSTFHRALGETSDVVSKEMFRVASSSAAKEVKDQDAVVLRPEFTAPIMRACLNAGILPFHTPAMLWYKGPAFRYERPQSGRLREFHQFGVETIGKSSWLADVQTILSAKEALDGAFSGNQAPPRYRIHINTLGDDAGRLAYSATLGGFLASKRDGLSKDSQARFDQQRYLRILDSKAPQDIELLREAPSLMDHVSPAARRRFDAVLEGLASTGVEVLVAPRLVRGLDYYSHTCFEFVHTESGLTVLAGGRYDGLAARSWGAGFPSPAVGWAAGVERLVALLDAEEQKTKSSSRVLVFATTPQAVAKALSLSSEMRRAGVEAHVFDEDEKPERAVAAALRLAKRLDPLLTVVVQEEDVVQVYEKPDERFARPMSSVADLVERARARRA